ncbi:MAG TPA: DUF416 domain-containing protein [Cyanobacteria bacterium UBA8543]|nr:DUF416 domain-containing protein [Cyanobacteria bacterium UBA8543]
MKLQFFKFDTLKKELERLSTHHRVAFAASCCERMLPNYNHFCRQVEWGNRSVPRTALDEIWQILQGKPADAARVSQLREDCGREDIFPDSLDFGDDCLEAQEALIALRATLKACVDPSVQRIVEVAKSARYTIETHIPYRDITFNVTQEKDGEEKFYEAIAAHPLAVREIAKETEDLQRLKETETLDRDFLEWLRTSFDNNGKSLIDLA